MTRRHRFCAMSSSLKAKSRAFVREPAPLVTRFAQPEGGEGRFDRVGGPQVLPVLGREVEETEQAVLVARQRLDSLGVLGAVLLDEALDLRLGVLAAVGAHDLVQRPLGLRLQPLRQLVEHVFSRCTQQRCSLVSGHTSRTVRQRPRAPSSMARIGTRSPRRFRSRSTLAQLSALSR